MATGILSYLTESLNFEYVLYEHKRRVITMQSIKTFPIHGFHVPCELMRSKGMCTCEVNSHQPHPYL